MTRDKALTWRKKFDDEIYILGSNYSRSIPYSGSILEISNYFIDCLNDIYMRTIDVLPSCKWADTIISKEELIDKIGENVIKNKSNTLVLRFALSNLLNIMIRTTVEELINRNLKDTMTFAEIIPGDTCEDCLGREGQIILASELTDLPPYHLTCNCFVIYFNE